MSKEKKTFVLEEGSGAYEIQKEVRTLLSFRTIEEWDAHLKKAGKNHTAYYHYTTLGALKAICKSQSFKLNLATISNDPNEAPVYAASFTVHSLTSMAMWHWYGKMACKKSVNDIGVRIRIPQDAFLKIFENGELMTEDKESVHGKLEIADVAYWHFGQKKSGIADHIFYKGYDLPFNAFGTYDRESLEKLDAKAHSSWQRPDPAEPISPCFKRAVWRSENETRVFCDLSSRLQKETLPNELFVKIPDELFGKMEIKIAPDFNGFAAELIARKTKLQTSQIKFSTDQEAYHNTENTKNDKNKKG